MNYAPEEIPDGDLLLKWFPRSKFKDGKPYASAYANKGVGMSADWARYSTAEDCRAPCIRPRSKGVVSLHVGTLRAHPHAQHVRHTPKNWQEFPRQGQAHTDVVGLKDPEAQLKLARLAVVEIHPDPEEVADSLKKKSDKPRT